MKEQEPTRFEHEIFKQGRRAINEPGESLTKLEDRMYVSKPDVPLTNSVESYRNLLTRARVPQVDIERLCKEFAKNVNASNDVITSGVLETQSFSDNPTDLNH